MRINPNPTLDLLAALSLTQEDQQTALEQLASGRRVNKPSDDPAAAAVLVQNHARASQADEFLRSIGSIGAQLETVDSALNSVVLALQRALTLGVEGANGTLSDGNRAALVDELDGIKKQLVGLGNLSFQGRFVFAGTASQSPPFVLDSTAASGIRYDGNANVNAVAVGNGFSLQINQPGSQVFTASGSDVFQAISDLVTALQTGSSTGASIVSVRQALDHIAIQRVFYGNALNQMDSQQTLLNSEKLELSRQEDAVGGADMAVVVSRLTNAQNARNATLAAAAKVSQISLFDFLR